MIPANTLTGNQSYDAELMFVKVVGAEHHRYPGAMGVAAYVTQTDFAIQTVIPPPPQGVLQFSANAYRAREPDGQVTITVTRTGGTQGEVRVDYATTNGSAAASAGLRGCAGTLTFGDGVATQTFSISC